MLIVPDNEPLVAPLPEQNEVDAVGRRSAADIARDVVRSHRAGLAARRERDLISEKLLLHVDGSGDLQWADILFGDRVEIPRIVSEYRKTENLLRLVVDNAVAHHTTMPLRYYADSLPDRRARDRATIDTVWMNHVVNQQDLNGLFAEALYMAMAAGFCPVHAYWRDDPVHQHEPIHPGMEPTPEGILQQVFNPPPGMIDCWLGSPFDTVFDRGAKRGSVHWASYGRVLPARLVRRAFAHIPEAAGLEGSTRIPSAASFQRIAREWRWEGLAAHGTPIVSYRRQTEENEELLILVCREILPGIDADYPEGRLQLVAVPGAVDLRRGETGSNGVLLADQPLPAGVFSWVNFYSHHRADDVHGKPWVEDIDLLQVDLNIALSKRWEVIHRMVEAPIVAPGGALTEDMADVGGYNLLEVEPSLGNWRPRVMEWPTQVLAALNLEVEDRRKAIFQGGGYQAASRGEAPGSRIAYRAIVALQQADNTIHGPVNQRFRRSACDFARICWHQMKAYGDIPWLVGITGDEYAHLVEPYIDNTKLSDTPPRYKLVNAFGPSPELRAQEVLELMATQGADGEPFLRTEEARRQYPNSTIFDDQGDPRAVQRRRAKTVASAFHTLAARLREQTGYAGSDLADPQLQQLAQQLFLAMESQYPRLRDDDLMAHLSTLSEITQDESSDPLARLAAMQRQALYYQWQAQMSATPGMQLPGGEQPAGGPQGGARPAPRSSLDRRAVAAQMGERGEGQPAPSEEASGPSPVATVRG
jgi:hypothetical protein